MTADAIKALRTELGWSQEKLAQALGVSWTTLQRWEVGRTVPSPLAVRALEQIASAQAVRRAADRPHTPPRISAAALSGKE